MVYVESLSKHPVDSYEQIAKKMDEGYTSRSIGATLMNQTSSRAHTIITIEFKQVREEEDEERKMIQQAIEMSQKEGVWQYTRHPNYKWSWRRDSQILESIPSKEIPT